MKWICISTNVISAHGGVFNINSYSSRQQLSKLNLHIHIEAMILPIWLPRSDMETSQTKILLVKLKIITYLFQEDIYLHTNWSTKEYLVNLFKV